MVTPAPGTQQPPHPPADQPSLASNWGATGDPQFYGKREIDSDGNIFENATKYVAQDHSRGARKLARRKLRTGSEVIRWASLTCPSRRVTLLVTAVDSANPHYIHS